MKTENPKAKVQTIASDTDYSTVQKAAKQSDVCLVFANADSGEGYITLGQILLVPPGDSLILVL